MAMAVIQPAAGSVLFDERHLRALRFAFRFLGLWDVAIADMMKCRFSGHNGYDACRHMVGKITRAPFIVPVCSNDAFVYSFVARRVSEVLRSRGRGRRFAKDCRNALEEVFLRIQCAERENQQTIQ